jgi:hypothetical protein
MDLIFFVVAHFAFIILLSLCSYALGRRLTYKVSYASVWEEVSFSTGLGLGCIAYIVLFLSLVHLLYLPFLLLALAITQLLVFPVWRKMAAGLRVAVLAGRRAGPLIAWLSLVIALTTPIWLLPLYPPLNFDATVYHLAWAKHYIEQHGLALSEYIRYPLFPQTQEMLLTLALYFDDIAAHLVQFLMMLLGATTLYSWGSRAFSHRVGLWSAGLWIANPLVLLLGASALIDLGLALFACLGTYAFFNWVTTREQRWLALSAIFVGLALGSKHTALFFLGTLGLVATYLAIQRRRWYYPFVFGIIAVGIALPWYLRSYYYSRNPVWPMLPDIFGYNWLWTDADQAIQLSDWIPKGMGHDMGSLLLLPWNLAQYQGRFGNDPPILTIVYWLLPLTLFWAIKSPYIRSLLALVVACYVAWFFAGAQIQRYVLPVLPIFILATVASLERTVLSIPAGRRLAADRAVVGIVLALILVPGWSYCFNRELTRGPMPVTQAERDEYLARWLPPYAAHKWLNEQHGSNYRVYGVRDEDMAYFTQGTYIGSIFGPAKNQIVIDSATSGKSLYDTLAPFDPDFFLVTSHRRELALPEDEAFQRHFSPVYQDMSVKLFWVRDSQAGAR